uniref:LRRNT domain-containing protein n=1 Tax=Cyprinus carpio TaxID=7962 RepID=A0A8C2HCV3_CYPCA
EYVWKLLFIAIRRKEGSKYQNRMDPGWFRAVNTQSCPLECDCPIHWPTALYCDHRSLIQLPSGLPSRTQYLFLQGNNFTIIESGVFANATNLRCEQLDDVLFSNLTRLVNLFINDNNLTRVPVGLPSGPKQLHNKLRNEGLDPGAFNLTSLVELDLSYNQLTEIPTVPTTLQYLYFEVNNIQEFSMSSFCRTTGPTSYSRMKILRLDGNKLEYHKLPPDWVFCLHVLHNIYI